MSSQEISIAGRRIGSGQPPYIIAELSGNHNGKIERAFALMEMAKNGRIGSLSVVPELFAALQDK